MTDQDRGTVRWFGASWGAPCCEPEDHVATPVGQPCLRCGKPIAEGDQGITMPYMRSLNGELPVTIEPFHLDCYLDSIRPCPGCPHCKPEKFS